MRRVWRAEWIDAPRVVASTAAEQARARHQASTVNLIQNGTRVASIRDHNQALVLGLILRLAGPSRSEIAARIRLTAAAVSRITRDLIDAGLVAEGEQQRAMPGQRGRRNIALLPRPKGAFFLAVSLTIADRRVALLDLAGRRLGEATIPGGLPRDYPALIEAITTLSGRLLAEAGAPKARVLGLCAVTAGAVDRAAGTIIDTSLAALRGRPLACDLSTQLGMPVVVETVGRAMGVAEALAASQQDGPGLPGATLVVHVAFGIGTALLLEGVPVRSVTDERLASHVAVAGGKTRCICGAMGCLMAEAAGFGILKRLAAEPERITGWAQMRPRELQRAVARANAGDGAALFAAAGRALGTTLFALGASVGPQQVVLGGPMTHAEAFADAAAVAHQEAYRRAGLVAPRLILSGVDYLGAAEKLALVEFALARASDLGPLLVRSRGGSV